MGKKLVVELGLDDSVDTLGRWMAHHIAELISEAESASENERSAKQVALREAVLALWAHRSELPSGKRPLGELEPILRALESLDPDGTSYRYFTQSRIPEGLSAESQKTQEWVKRACELDKIVRDLISYCLSVAAEGAIDKSKEWVELAGKGEVINSADVVVIRILAQHSKFFENDASSLERRFLEERQKRLEVLQSMASVMLNDIKARLDSLPPPVGQPGAKSLDDQSSEL